MSFLCKKSAKKRSKMKSQNSLRPMEKKSPSNCENRKSVAFTVWEEIDLEQTFFYIFYIIFTDCFNALS